MSLRKSNVIDALSEEDATGVLVLSLFDESDWSEVSEHWDFLCIKLGHYLSFVASGEVLEHYPDHTGKGIRIEVVFRHAPPDEVIAAMSKTQEFVASQDCALAWAVHAS